jgi:1-acylglycerol-3-phosphate O-acyltransferase
MEKYSQFRDRGSGISPFLPHQSQVTSAAIVGNTILFLFRLPLFVLVGGFFFLLLAHLPVPRVIRKVYLWCLTTVSGIWWKDLQVDGVKRGHLSEQPGRMPQPGAIIAAQFTSPIDALYLGAIFDPIFTRSYPDSAKVQRISLREAVLLALAPVCVAPADPKKLTTLRKLLADNPRRFVAVFPECSTTNGKGLLPLSPSLLSAPADAKVYPVSIRYTPQDITTPVPGAYFTFLWNLLSRATLHCMRVRIGAAVTREEFSDTSKFLEPSAESEGEDSEDYDKTEEDPITPEGRALLDHVAETLARLARNKRVGLTLRDKAAFVEAWNKGRR